MIFKIPSGPEGWVPVYVITINITIIIIKYQHMLSV